MRLQRPGVCPTGAGWSLLGLALVLVLMAINEANNLLYALAFVLLSVWLVGAAQAWHNLVGLELSAVDAAPVSAGETGLLTVRLDPQGRARVGLDLRVGGEKSHGSAGNLVDLEGGRAVRCDLPWRATHRGWQTLSTVHVQTRFPLGLAVAQRPLPVAIQRLVWPHPVPVDRAASAPSAAHLSEQADQFTGLSPWRAGDSPRRLAWKAMARAGAPMVKRFDGGDGQQAMTIDWRDTEGDTEHRLAVLTRRVLDAEHRFWPWQLVMPGRTHLPQGPGSAALHRALAALALHGADGAGDTA